MSSPTDLQTRLESEVLEVEWDALRPHVERDALILIGPELPLIKAALAIALDVKDDVAAWMAAGHLTKATATAAYNNADRFRFVIVQPFVLAQLIEPTSPRA